MNDYQHYTHFFFTLISLNFLIGQTYKLVRLRGVING